MKAFLLFSCLLTVHAGFAQSWDLINEFARQMGEMVRQNEQRTQELMKSFEDRRKNMKADDTKTLIFKNEKEGKYGIIFYFNDEVGANISSNPTRVYTQLGDGDLKDISNSCTYWGEMIIVPPTFKLNDPDDRFTVLVGSHGEINAHEYFRGYEYVGRSGNYD